MILVVDDETTMVLNLFEATLKRLGMMSRSFVQCFEASLNEMGIRHECAEREPALWYHIPSDLVLTDIVMPNLDGTEMIRQLRHQARLHHYVQDLNG